MCFGVVDKHVSVTLMNTSMTYIVNGGWVKSAELSARINKGDNIKCVFDRDYIYVDSTYGSDYIDEVVDEELTNMNIEVYPNEEFFTSVIGKIIDDNLGGASIYYVDEFNSHDDIWHKIYGLKWRDSFIKIELSKDGDFKLVVDGDNVPVPQSMSVDDCLGEIKKRIVTLIPF